jgi:hypothetical protein
LGEELVLQDFPIVPSDGLVRTADEFLTLSPQFSQPLLFPLRDELIVLSGIRRGTRPCIRLPSSL